MSASLGLDAAGRGPEVAYDTDRAAEARRAGKDGPPDLDCCPWCRLFVGETPDGQVVGLPSYSPLISGSEVTQAWSAFFEVQPDAVLALAAAELARRQVDRQAGTCTGVSAKWCPIHGDCTCPETGVTEDPECLLHARSSSHPIGAAWRTDLEEERVEP